MPKECAINNFPLRVVRGHTREFGQIKRATTMLHRTSIKITRNRFSCSLRVPRKSRIDRMIKKARRIKTHAAQEILWM